MPHSNIIPADTEQETWKIIEQQLSEKNDDKDYSAQFSVNGHAITLDIDFHPESGNEKGNATTTFVAPLSDKVTFRFLIDRQHLKNEIKKLFGMQDVIIGHNDFDRRFIIQGNDVAKVKEMLAKPEVYNALLNRNVESFETRELKIGAHRETVLSLEIEERITDVSVLKELYQAFKLALGYVE